jgi:hypothetical protein
VVENNYSIFVQGNSTVVTDSNTNTNATLIQNQTMAEEEFDETKGTEATGGGPRGATDDDDTPSIPLVTPLTSSNLDKINDSPHTNTNNTNTDDHHHHENTLEMIVYKKHDHLNTWVHRYLTCDGEYLHYYHDLDDVFPKKSILIDEYLKVQMDILPVMIEGQKRYYPFTLTHGEMKIQFIFACQTMEESLQWSTLIQKIQRKNCNGGGGGGGGGGVIGTTVTASGGGGGGGVQEGDDHPPLLLSSDKKHAPFKITTKQISDEIQYFQLDHDSEDSPGGSTQNLSLTRLVLSSLPLYYLTILWRYLSLSASLSLSLPVSLSACLCLSLSLSLHRSHHSLAVVPVISKLFCSSFS